MRKLVSLLLLLAMGSIALLLVLQSERESRTAESKPAPMEEVAEEHEIAELAPPAEAEEVRSPVPPGRAEATSETARTTLLPPRKTEPDPLSLRVRFTGLPEEESECQATLILEPMEPGELQIVTRIITSEWDLEIPKNFENGLWIEAFLFEGPDLCSRRVSVSFLSSRSQEVTLDLRPRARLEGRVLDEMLAPIPQASIRMSWRYFGFPGEADENGRFTAKGGLDGVHTLEIEAEGFFDLKQEITFATSERRFEDFILKRPMRVAGIIRWPFGAPAEDVSLFLRSAVTGEQTDTDSEGRFDFTGGPAMKFVLYARFGGEAGQDFSGRFELDPQLQDLRNLDLVLQRSPSVTGALLDDAGLAVSGINVQFMATDNSRVTREATTQVDGTFTVRGLYPGNYSVTCSKSQQLLATVEVEPGRTEPFLELRLPPEEVLSESD